MEKEEKFPESFWFPERLVSKEEEEKTRTLCASHRHCEGVWLESLGMSLSHS